MEKSALLDSMLPLFELRLKRPPQRLVEELSESCFSSSLERGECMFSDEGSLIAYTHFS